MTPSIYVHAATRARLAQPAALHAKISSHQLINLCACVYLRMCAPIWMRCRAVYPSSRMCVRVFCACVVFVMRVVSELPRVNDCLIKYFNDNIVRIKRELITHLLTLMRN